MEKPSFYVLRFVLLLTICITVGCGAIATGTGALNQQPPNAPIAAQGSFTPGTGSVSGNVTIYTLGSGSYEVFLNNFSGPTTFAGLLLIVKDSSGNQLLSTALQSSSGNQGYLFSASSSANFAQVTIHQSSPPQDLNQAQMTAS